MRCKMSILGCAVALLFVLAGSAMAWPVPDTGQTGCYDVAGTPMSCASPGEYLHGQDANYNINPPSYTKLDASGGGLPDDANAWAMVRDNVTGLIWEAKTNKDEVKNYADLHDADNSYTWYDSNPATNGGNAGTPGEGTDTEDFIKALNVFSFGGRSDWRMPTRKELRSIVDYGNYPMTNTTYFPETTDLFYWSSTTDAVNSEKAWRMDYVMGNDGSIRKSISYCVRAVCGGQPGALEKLVNNGDGTVTDTSTGLMWQQATPEDTRTWANALSYCENLSLAEFTDWRLPTIKEMDSIADLTRYKPPAINTDFFPDTQSSNYVTSTTWAPTTSNACHYVFSTGYGYYYYKNYWGYARAVRGGQHRVTGHLVVSNPAQAGTYLLGSTLPIRWDTAGIGGNVRISLSRDGGKTYRTLVDQVTNNGTYDWMVTGPATVNCLLRIEPLSDISRGTIQGLFTLHYDPELADIIRFLQLVSGMETPEAIDLTGDGIVDVSDAIYSLQFEAGLR